MTTNPPVAAASIMPLGLPPEARSALVRAAREAKLMPDPFQREMHIDAAIQRIRVRYPEFFHWEAP